MAKIIKCMICGIDVAYTTKKPSKCKECNEKSKEIRKPRGRSKKLPANRWKSEQYMFQVLAEMFPRADYCLNGYYSWLPSPKKSPMQLDWYSYELGIAFEFEGIQHYEFTPYFHKSKKEFQYLQECDKVKRELCEQEGIVLISVRYDLDMDAKTISELIRKQAPELYKDFKQNKKFII